MDLILQYGVAVCIGVPLACVGAIAYALWNDTRDR